MIHRLLMLAALIAGAPAGLCQSKPPAADLARLATFLRALGDPDPVKRREAERALLAMPPSPATYKAIATALIDLARKRHAIAKSLPAPQPPPKSKTVSKKKRPGTRGLSDAAEREPESRGGALAYRKRHALVVGIDRYLPPFSNLEGPAYDAAGVAYVLHARFGFENVVLLVDAVPKRFHPPAADPAGRRSFRMAVAGRVTLDVLRAQLARLRRQVAREDALFFFYAGHGLRGSLAPSGSHPGRPHTLLSYRELASALKSCDAHHTLAVLDCCYGGSFLERDFGAGAVGTLQRRFLGVGGTDSLSRVFNRRSFQVITAGAGTEEVADQVSLSKQYAGLQRGLHGHSPFTASLLEGMLGLAGLPDGRLRASDLAYYLNESLINDPHFLEVAQTPRYQQLGQVEGDLFFFPRGKVLNPKLLAPLYLAGNEYAQLRASACRALGQFVAAQPPGERASLVASAIPHLSRLLADDDPERRPRLASAQVLGDLALSHAGDVAEFARVVAPLASVLAAELRKRQPHGGFCRLAGRALGVMAPHATPGALEVMSAYVARLSGKWSRVRARRRVPGPVRRQLHSLAALGVAAPSGRAPRMRRFAAQRALYQWLLTEGRRLVDRLQDQLEKEARMLLAKANEALANGHPRAAALLCARSLASARTPEGLRRFLDLYTTTAGTVHRSHLGHTSSISALSFDRASRRLITASGDRTARVWDVASGASRLVLRHGSKVNAASFSVDGSKVVTGADDGHARLWDAATGQEIRRVKIPAGWLVPVRTAQLSPDGKWLLTGSNDKRARIWEAATGKLRFTSPDLRDAPGGEFDRKGKRVLVHTRSAAPRILDLGSGRWTELGVEGTRRRQSGVRTASFTPDGERVLTVTASRWSAEIWDARSGARRRELGAGLRHWWAAFDPSGRRVVTTSSDLKIRVFDAAAGDILAIFESPGRTPGMAWFSPRGDAVVAVAGSRLRMWDLASSQARLTLDGLKDPTPATVSFSADLKWLAAVHGPGVRTWDMRPGSFLFRELRGHLGYVHLLGFDRRRGRMTTWAHDRTVKSWELATGRLVASVAALHRRAPFASPCGRWLVAPPTSRRSGSIGQIIDVERGTRTELRHEGRMHPIYHAVFRPDGKVVVTTSGYGPPLAWEVATGRRLAVLGDAKSARPPPAFSPNGRTIAVGLEDRTVRVHDARSFRQLSSFEVGEDLVCLEFSPDGRRLFTSASKETGHLRDPSSGRTLRLFRGEPVLRLTRVRFDASGARLAAGYRNRGKRCIQVWETSTGERLGTARLADGDSDEFAFSPNGKWLAIPYSRHEHQPGLRRRVQRNGFTLADAGSGKRLIRVRAHAWPCTVHFAPGSSLLVTTSGDGTGKIWDLSLLNASGRELLRLERLRTALHADSDAMDEETIVEVPAPALASAAWPGRAALQSPPDLIAGLAEAIPRDDAVEAAARYVLGRQDAAAAWIGLAQALLPLPRGNARALFVLEALERELAGTPGAPRPLLRLALAACRTAPRTRRYQPLDCRALLQGPLAECRRTSPRHPFVRAMARWIVGVMLWNGKWRWTERNPLCRAFLGAAVDLDREEAVTGLTALLRVERRCWPAWEQRGRAQLLDGKVEEASADLARAVQLMGGYRAWEPHFHLGMVRLLGGKRKEALASLLAVPRLYRGRRDRAAYPLLWVLAAGGRRESARALRRIASFRKPGGFLARFALGKMSEEALVRECNRQDEENRRASLCEAYGYMGLLYEGRGEAARARECYRKCLAQGIESYSEWTGMIVLWSRLRLTAQESRVDSRRSKEKRQKRD